MKTFLAIDWDYFIDATTEERMLLFPDGGNEGMPDYLRDVIWSLRYVDSKRIKANTGERAIEDIQKLKKEYQYMKKFLSNLGDLPCGVSVHDSHSAAYKMFSSNLDKDEKCAIINIDYHHDLYSNVPGIVDCGNWLTELHNDGKLEKLTWISREDSDKLPSEYEAVDNIVRTTELYATLNSVETIDGVFLCKSGMWSPPHLDVAFTMLSKALCKSNTGKTVGLQNRYTKEFKQKVELIYNVECGVNYESA